MDGTDFDAFAVWTMQNLGAGNLVVRGLESADRTGHLDPSERGQSGASRSFRGAVAQGAAASQQIDISEQRLIEAEDGFREEFARIRGGEGLPIELLDNLTRNIAARQTMVSTIVAYDKAQFNLFVALGQPPTSACSDLRPLSGPEGK